MFIGREKELKYCCSLFYVVVTWGLWRKKC